MKFEAAEVKAERPIARGIIETAAAVGVSPSFIRKVITNGELQSTRLGRRVVVRQHDLEAWLNRGVTANGGERG